MRALVGYLSMIVGSNQALIGNGRRLSLYLVNEVKMLIGWVSDTHYVYRGNFAYNAPQ